MPVSPSRRLMLLRPDLPVWLLPSVARLDGEASPADWEDAASAARLDDVAIMPFCTMKRVM